MRNWAILFSAFLFSIIFWGCQPAESTIKYTASGTGGTLTVNYVDASGYSQVYTGSSPWQLNFSAKSGAQLSVSAGCGPNGTSVVDIYINGADKAHDSQTAVNSSASITVP